MPWPITSDPVRFEQAEEWFRARVPMTPSAYDALGQKWKRRAFKISGISQLALVSEVQDLIERGIAEGASLRDYRETMLERLTQEWGGTVKNPSARLDTIIRNAHQSAYNAGRYGQMTKPSMMRVKPFWQYDAVVDEDTTTICRERNGVIRPATDDFWARNFPPLHHRCRATVKALTKKQAERAGGVTEGAVYENEPQRGWGYTPDRDEWNPDLSKYPKPLRDAWTRKFGEAPAEPEPEQPDVEPLQNDPRRVMNINDPKIRDLIASLDKRVDDGDLRSILDEYKPIIGDDPDVRMALSSNMNEWVNTFSNADYQGDLRKAYRAYRRGEGRDSLPENLRGVYDDVETIAGTRADRWQRRAEQLGIEPPTHFRLHRGARGDIFVDDIADAWANQQAGDMTRARSWNMASWSMDPKGAEHFVNLKDEDGVLFSADVPIEDTFADALVDDGTFVAQYMFEREVIVASDEDSPVRMAVEDARVKLDGRIYSYAEREDFLAAYRARRGG